MFRAGWRFGFGGTVDKRCDDAHRPVPLRCSRSPPRALPCQQATRVARWRPTAGRPATRASAGRRAAHARARAGSAARPRPPTIPGRRSPHPRSRESCRADRPLLQLRQPGSLGGDQGFVALACRLALTHLALTFAGTLQRYFQCFEQGRPISVRSLQQFFGQLPPTLLACRERAASGLRPLPIGDRSRRPGRPR